MINSEANHDEYDRKVAKLAWVKELGEALGLKVVQRQEDKYVYVEIGDPDAPEMVMALSHLDSPTGSIKPGGNLDRWVNYDGQLDKTAYHTPYVRDGWLYGAGVQDDSGPTLATLFAAKALQDSGVEFDRRIRIVMGCYEDGSPAKPSADETLSYIDIPYYSAPSFYDNWTYKALNREETPIAAYTSDSRFPVVVGKILLLWIVGLYVLCRTLYNKRPAESAGRAMAFTKANTVIKVLLVIPSALYSGIIFYSLGNARYIFWLIFGVVFGVFVIHALIECIYEFDVRAIFCHKKQLIVIMLGSLFIMASFSADLFGYDRYIPKASRVDSIEIKPLGVNSYGYWGKGEERSGLNGEEKQLALSVIKESVEVKNNAETSSSEYYEKNSKFLFFSSVSKKEVMRGDIEISTTFYMKNGNRKVRNYILRSQKAKELYNKLYATREFKKNIYSLYTRDYNDIKEITWSGIETEYLNLTKEEKKQFFDTYLSELDGLSYTDVQKTVPVGNIDISIGGTMGSENAIQDTYYIYPSFKKTLAFLAQKGCAVNQTIDNLDISSIGVEGYDGNTGENIRYGITDKKRINKLKKKLVLQQMENVPGITVINGGPNQ